MKTSLAYENGSYAIGSISNNAFVFLYETESCSVIQRVQYIIEMQYINKTILITKAMNIVPPCIIKV